MAVTDAQFRNLPELIDLHLQTHKGMELRDIYKMLHQSVFGPEHLGPAVAEEAIEKEMHGADAGFEESLLEPISIDVSACRINLRTAKNLGISAAVIAKAVNQSVEGFSRRVGELGEMWRCVGDSLTGFAVQFQREDFEELTRLVHGQGFPSLHHSDSYRKCNRPAYRVLKKQVWDLFRPLSPSSASDQ